MLESDVIIFQECILNYGRIKSSNSESTLFGTPCILMLFVIANCFLLLATSLHAPSTLTFYLEVNTLCQYLLIFYNDNLMMLTIAFIETQYSIYSSSSLASHLLLSSSSSVCLFLEVNSCCQYLQLHSISIIRPNIISIHHCL